MLGKKFKANKYYEVRRCWRPFFQLHNNEITKETVTVWDSLEKAKAYIHRYAAGLQSAQIRVVNLDREITVDEYKTGKYNIKSFQTVYAVTENGIDETPRQLTEFNVITFEG